jgi:XrtN system VIT domain protein
MLSISTKLKDGLLAFGWALILISLSLFSLPLLFNTGDQPFPLFLLNYTIAVLYWAYLLNKRKVRIQENRIHHRFCLLVLFLISAFSLNREMNVFETSTTWLTCLIVLVSVNYLLAVFFEDIPVPSRYVSVFVLGVGFVLFIYYSLFLFPLYIISFFGLIGLGLSIHTFIPLIISINTIILINRLADGKSRYWAGFSLGVLLSIGTMFIYALQWNREVKKINNSYASINRSNSDLPGWMNVASHSSSHYMSEKVLKTDLVYRVSGFERSLFMDLSSMSLDNEKKVHDPLIVTAALFSVPLMPSKDERIRILESKYKARYQAVERLWSGNDLTTEKVETHVRIWPEMHLSYTEQLITVFNHSPEKFRGEQEGIYTLHMPEGAVISSLSLWVNGVEEKAILTTPDKATEAYRTIVGTERRDPSILHWQEGNTVSVKVFPVMPRDSRTFKVGITAPLQKNGDHLEYDNIWFFGPDPSSADEKITVEMMGSSKSFDDSDFSLEEENTFTREGDYRPRWSLQFKDQGLRPHTFNFDGASYSLSPYQRQMETADVKDVYLDINNSWTLNEFQSVWKAISGKNVYVHDNEMIRMNETNRQALYEKLSARSFSLFPFQNISDADHSLVISKSGAYSPNLKELQGTPFFTHLQTFSKKREKVRFYNLGKELSCFLRSVKEFRLLQYDQGDVENLTDLLSKNEFPKDQEGEQAIVIHNAELVIEKKEGNGTSTAPDHLMRLFVYNHIMEQLGIDGFDRSAVETDTLAIEAKKAYVVSPVSSLIVLETQKDYDRFGISDTKTTLQNASMGSSGAVPEPHEWALIILAAMVVLYLYVRSKF